MYHLHGQISKHPLLINMQVFNYFQLLAIIHIKDNHIIKEHAHTHTNTKHTNTVFY